MTDYKALAAELLTALEIQLDELALTNRLCKRARAALAEGDGVEPSTAELRQLDWFIEFAQWLAREMPAGTVIGDPQWWAPRIARNAIRRFLDSPDLARPIPVAERLPTAADCDAEGRCWWLTCGSEATAPYWYLADCEYPARAFPFDPSAWLPAAAIPLPEASP